MNLTTSLAFAGLVDYTYFIVYDRIHRMPVFEFLGIVGGVLSLLKRVHMFCGRVLLSSIGCAHHMSDMKIMSSSTKATRDGSSKEACAEFASNVGEV
jgi:hypothetical protein